MGVPGPESMNRASVGAQIRQPGLERPMNMLARRQLLVQRPRGGMLELLNGLVNGPVARPLRTWPQLWRDGRGRRHWRRPRRRGRHRFRGEFPYRRRRGLRRRGAAGTEPALRAASALARDHGVPSSAGAGSDATSGAEPGTEPGGRTTCSTVLAGWATPSVAAAAPGTGWGAGTPSVPGTVSAPGTA